MISPVSLSSIGLIVGFLVGLTGMGGGALMTPTLILIGLAPLHAVGLDLAYMSITKAFGSFLHFRKGHIDFRSAKFLLAGSLTAALGGFFILKYMLATYNHDSINNIIGIALAIVVLSVALINLVKIFLDRQQPAEDILLSSNRKISLLLAGGLVGLIIQFTSVGSGIIVTTFLMTFLTSHRVVGTDIFYGFVVTTFCALLHWNMGNVDFSMLLPLVLGSLPGMYLGALTCHRVPTRPLRGILILVLIVVSIVLLQQRAGALFGS